MNTSAQKPPVSPYVHSVVSGLAHSLSFEAWRVLPANFRKALCAKQLHFCLKAGIAAVLSDYLAEWAGLQHGLWAPMSALIVMQVQVSASVDASLMRLLGTVVGGAMGLLAFWVMHTLEWGIVPAIFFVGFTGTFLEVWDARFRMASITAVLVLLLGGTEFSATYTFAVDRVLEMGMGIISALVVSAFLWPHSMTQDLAKTVQEQVEQSAVLLHSLTAAFVQEQKSLPPSLLDAFLDGVSTNTAEYKKVRDYEAYYARVAFPHLQLYLRLMDAIRMYLAGMFDALRGAQNAGAPLLLQAEVLALTTAMEGALRYIAAVGGEASVRGNGAQGRNGAQSGSSTQAVPLRAHLAALRTRVDMLRVAGYFLHMDGERVVQIFAFYHALFRLGSVVACMQDHMQRRLQQDEDEDGNSLKSLENI